MNQSRFIEVYGNIVRGGGSSADVANALGGKFTPTKVQNEVRILRRQMQDELAIMLAKKTAIFTSEQRDERLQYIDTLLPLLPDEKFEGEKSRKMKAEVDLLLTDLLGD